MAVMSWNFFAVSDYSPNADITISSIEDVDVKSASCFTYPAYHSLLEKAASGKKTEDNLLAFVACADGVTIGLVLAREAKNAVTLLSIMTSEPWRRHGIGTAMIQKLIQESRRLSCNRIIAGYTTKITSLTALEHFLAATGWNSPEPDMYMSMFHVKEMLHAQWLSKVSQPPPGYELISFSELQTEERSRLNASLDAGDIPQGLSPFADEEYMVPELSIGLRYDSDIVAWQTLIRSPFIVDALCYRSLFVSPKMRTGNGFGPLVATEAFYRHAKSPICNERPKGVYGTAFTAIKQLNFARKRLNPYCIDIYESRKVTFVL